MAVEVQAPVKPDAYILHRLFPGNRFPFVVQGLSGGKRLTREADRLGFLCVNRHAPFAHPFRKNIQLQHYTRRASGIFLNTFETGNNDIGNSVQLVIKLPARVGRR